MLGVGYLFSPLLVHFNTHDNNKKQKRGLILDYGINI